MNHQDIPESTKQQEQNLKEETAKGFFWGGINSSTQQIFQIIFGIIMLRLLDPKDYGVVGMLAIFTAVAMIIQDSGFITALINKKNIQDKDYNAVFWFNATSSIIMYIILFFTAPVIANFFNRPILIPISRVLFLSFLFGGFSIVHHAYLIKNLMIKEKAKVEISALLISSTIGIILAFKGFAYWAITIQNVMYFVTAMILRWIYTPWKPNLQINLNPLKEMFSFSIKIFFTSIFNKITENIFSALLGKYYDDQTVGYYTQGNKWAAMGGGFISGMMGSVTMPVLTQISEEKERQKNAFRKMFRFGAFISFPLLLGLAFVGKEFLLIIGGGDKWQPAVPFLQLFCIWNSTLFIYTLYTHLLLTHKKSDIFMCGTLLINSLQLIALVFTFKYGIFQMIIIYISIYFSGFLFWHYHTNKLIGLKIRQVIQDISLYLITAIVCILIAWAITKNIDNLYIRLVLKIVITAMLYLTIIWKSNSVIIKESFYFLKQKLSHNKIK